MPKLDEYPYAEGDYESGVLGKTTLGEQPGISVFEHMENVE